MIFGQLSIVTVLLATVSVTLSSASANSLASTKVVEDFEYAESDPSVCGIQGSCPDPIPGISNFLLWNNIEETAETTSGSGNPALQTPNKGFFYGTLSESAKGLASASANYNDSKVASFDLSSFALGCSGTISITNPPGAPPGTYTGPGSVDCLFVVRGYKRGPTGKPSATYNVKFKATASQSNPNGVPSWPMRVFQLPKSFKQLRTVTFEAQPVANASYDGLKAGIDTVTYIVNTKSH